jgi:hypothetical protein
MRTALTALSLVVLLALAPSRGNAQETQVRFPVVEVRDTTFTFRIGPHQWVRPGLRGIVVDPREQDVLVARFRVSGVGGGTARAVVTGQTTSLTSLHTVLLEPPPTPWYRERFFWLGAAAGAIAGFLLGEI